MKIELAPYGFAQVGFRWAGDANIAICVELMGGAARMVPRVSNLSVAGTFRIILSPLVPTIPCFGAAVISLRQAAALLLYICMRLSRSSLMCKVESGLPIEAHCPVSASPCVCNVSGEDG